MNISSTQGNGGGGEEDRGKRSEGTERVTDGFVQFISTCEFFLNLFNLRLEVPDRQFLLFTQRVESVKCQMNLLSYLTLSG